MLVFLLIFKQDYGIAEFSQSCLENEQKDKRLKQIFKQMITICLSTKIKIVLSASKNIHNICFSLRNKKIYIIIWILFLARARSPCPITIKYKILTCSQGNWTSREWYFHSPHQDVSQ